MHLTGFSPVWKIFGRGRRICEKEANFEINKSLNKNSKVRLYLFSPFSFSDPFWYGNYFQEIRVEINGDYLTERRLDEGENIIEFDLKNAKLRKIHNFIKLKFKYHLPFQFNRLWKTSALLEKIEVR